ncbi:MAG: hypothetical protein KF819_05050 [Labilithrix sp.]|nr:hypothetical protein [Labilithrix sp.]
MSLTGAPPPVPAERPRLTWARGALLVLPLVYVAGTAVSAGEASPRAWLAIAVGIAVALAGAFTHVRVWTSSALSIAAATVALSQRWPALAFARELALLGAGVSAVRAVFAIERDAGLGARASDAIAARSVEPKLLERAALAIVVLAWGAAAGVDFVVWIGASPDLANVASMIAAAGGAASLFGVGAAALFLSGVRRLELGAPPRAIACAAAAGVGLLVAIAVALTTSARADAAAAIGAALAFPAVVRLAQTKDGLELATRGRRAMTLALFGGPVAMLAAVAAEGHTAGGGLVALFVALATLAIGSVAAKLEEPLLPMKGRLLDSLAEATRAAHDREARAAIANALAHLRDAAGQGAPSPELWMLHPTRICTIDAAGYLNERPAELPAAILDVAAGEPEGTVRLDVLQALEVRRPDLRPLQRWLEDRGALFATLVAEGEEPDGLVIVPAGARVEPLTIDEVRAAKRFADAFVAVCQARSARERHLERERELRDRIDALDDELERAAHATSLDGSRNVLASARLARPATVGIYAAASRMAYEALERSVARGAPVAIVARAGVDPVPYVARAHLGGPRREAPLVIVDGTSSREHDVERWKHEHTSPIALADRGLLVLVDGAALPRDVQVLIARALSERRPPWERATPLDVAVALTATADPDALAEQGRLTPELHARFEEARPIELPGLRDRAEDLFSIVADRLAREGLRVSGKPIGIDQAAFAHLVEHPFESEDAELASIVSRLAARVTSEGRDVVRAADVVRVLSPGEQAGEPERSASRRS